MEHEAAADLLHQHQERISRSAARHIRALVPRYRDLDATALERNMRTLVRGMEHLLRRGDETRLVTVVEDIVELRATSGFHMNETLMAGMCLMPVLRRFFVQAVPDTRTALAYYDVVEELGLPVIAALAEAFAAAERAREENRDDPDVFKETFLSAMSEEGGAVTPFPFAPLFDDDEEDTVRSARR